MPDPTTDPCPGCNGDGESDQSPLPCPICLGSRVDPNAQDQNERILHDRPDDQGETR